MLDAICGALLLSSFVFATAVYLLRDRLSIGRPSDRFERVERQGAGPLLGKPALRMGYWLIEPLGQALHRRGVSANQLTWGSLLLAIVAALSWSAGFFGAGSIVAAIAMICDSLDGLVARLRGSQSEAGSVLDSAIDRYVEFLFFGALFCYYGAYFPGQALVLFAILGSFMVSYSSAKAEILGVSVALNLMKRPERMAYLLAGAVLSAISGPFEFVAGDKKAMAYPMIFVLAMIAVLANISAVVRLRAIIRYVQARDRRTPEPREEPGATPASLQNGYPRST